MVATIHDVPRASAGLESGDGIEHEIDESRALWRRRPFHEDEFVRNALRGELLCVETKRAEKPRTEIDAVIVVAPGQDDAQRWLARGRPDPCVRQRCHSRSRRRRNDASQYREYDRPERWPPLPECRV